MTTDAPGARAHGIDALRGLAASGVVIVHSVFILPLGVEFRSWYVDYLSMGVALFFVISAFSMCLAYPGGGRTYSLKTFAIRRFLRIAPLFYLMLLAWCWLYMNPSTEDILKNLTFTFAFWPETQVSIVPAGWSIGIEAVFYLLFPILCFWRGLVPAGLLLVLTLALCAYFNATASSDVDFFFWTNVLTNAPYFAFGVLAWSIYRIIPQQRAQVIALACLVSSLCLGVLMFLYGPEVNSEQALDLRVPLELVLGWGTAFALLVLSLALNPWRVIVNGPTLLLGKISYSLYLMHPLLIYWSGVSPKAAALTDDPNLVVPIVGAVMLALAIPIAYAIYRIVELPFIRLGKRLTTGGLSRVSAV